MSQPHEKLVAWQRADELCVGIYRLTREKLPPSERYELSKQFATRGVFSAGKSR